MKTTRFAPEKIEKYSSAVTLSDMEIFVFPELLYALVLANIMSPRVWAWRNDPWFEKIGKMSPQKKINRLKQYIIDRYEFNLDLDTWGLTDQQTEIKRFAPFMDEATISRSNALFGYEGDRHYFDLDIRRHFGLEKYTDEVIPYWKTETVEAMDAFRHREGYRGGAGECVSLSTLYAAALFVVCGIPLEDIFLMATPLHSQNFIDISSGILTNNRRIVTKNMWFNGTELTFRSQRALRNEQVTMVFNNTGYIHCIYPEYTINEADYARFKNKMSGYLSTEITFSTLANFLRQHSRFQKCFQLCHEHHGRKRWIPAEKVYPYEHSSSYKVSDNTRDQLLEEIDEYEFYSERMEGRICLTALEEFFHQNPIQHYDAESMAELGKKLSCRHAQKNEMLAELARFVHLEPRFPKIESKIRRDAPGIALTPDMKREEIIAYLQALRGEHETADLAFYAARDLSVCDPAPFLKAALERNPVCIEGLKELSDKNIVARIKAMPNESIYDGERLAQPDEVWNFQTGDGLEKALLLATVLRARHPDSTIELTAQPDHAELRFEEQLIVFESSKGLTADLSIS